MEPWAIGALWLPPMLKLFLKALLLTLSLTGLSGANG